MPVTRAASKKNSEPISVFFTTAAMEQHLDEEHNGLIKQMARKMKGRRSKYTPSTYVGCRATPFLVEGGMVTFRGGPCPTEEQHGGKMYMLVPKFADQVAEFHKRHNRYQVRNDIDVLALPASMHFVLNNKFQQLCPS